MNTIIKQFEEQFPEIYPSVSRNDRYATYAILNHFGNYCGENFEIENAKEILITINKVYQQKSIYACNAIENEFLPALAGRLGINDLSGNLEGIPETLRTVYLQVLIEIQKNNH